MRFHECCGELKVHIQNTQTSLLFILENIIVVMLIRLWCLIAVSILCAVVMSEEYDLCMHASFNTVRYTFKNIRVLLRNALFEFR
jgi:hypothetical protein